MTIIVRKMPSGVRGRFRYLYWTGTDWVADKREQAMEFTDDVKKVAFALAQNSCAGQRHKPKLVRVDDW